MLRAGIIIIIFSKERKLTCRRRLDVSLLMTMIQLLLPPLMPLPDVPAAV